MKTVIVTIENAYIVAHGSSCARVCSMSSTWQRMCLDGEGGGSTQLSLMLWIWIAVPLMYYYHI